MAKGQDRYLQNLPETIKFMENKITSGEIKSDIRISNTGLIFYYNFNLIIPMLYDIYNASIKFNQPECQIFWAIYSQKYLNYIKQIDYNEVDPVWGIP